MKTYIFFPFAFFFNNQVVGTYGYAAPDYIETGHLTSKSDVWSFGVVLYEILTGRRSLERNHPRAEQKLLEWVKNFPSTSKKFHMIMDQRLENQYPINAAKKIAKLADSCLLKSPKDRPKMSEVVETLKQIIQPPPSPDHVEESPESSQNDSDDKDKDKKGDEPGPSESWKRRMAHLASLGEHVEGANSHRKRFFIMQRAKVP